MASNRANRITPVVCNPVVVAGSDLPVIEECANDQGTGMEAVKGQIGINQKDVY